MLLRRGRHAGALLAALAILAAGAAVRAGLLTRHFSDVDDALVPLYLSHARVEPIDAAFARALIADPDAGAYVRSVRPLVERLDAAGLLDPLGAVARVCWPYVAMLVHSTYAPAQFVATAFLIEGSEPYRTAKTLARVPSFAFGLLGIVLSAAFLLRLRGPAGWRAALVAMAVVACSVQHVAYSVHASSYAASVVAVYAVLFLLDRSLVAPSRSMARAVVDVSVLASAFYLGYQALPFVAGWLGALLYDGWRRFPGERVRVVARQAGVGVAFALAFLPAYLLVFMHKAGLHWNAGPGKEFLFRAPESAWGGLAYGARFFAGNGFLVFRSQTAFLPEGSTPYWIVAVLLALLAMAGLRELLVDPNPRSRGLLACLAIAAVVVAGMCVTRRLTLSPSRHTMFLLPAIATLVGLGADALARRSRWGGVCTGLALAGYVSLFLLQVPRLVSERSDPFDEAQIRAVVEEYRATAVVAYAWTDQIALMPSLRERAHVFNDRRRVYSRSPEPTPGPGDLETVAFVSHQAPLDRASFVRALAGAMRQRVAGYEGPRLEDYEILYRHEQASDVGYEYSRRTRGGTNGLFVTVCRAKPAEAPAGDPAGAASHSGSTTPSRASRPPSTSIAAPVTKEARSLSRKAITSATSAAEQTRP